MTSHIADLIALCRKYHAEHGHLDVKQREHYDGVPLGMRLSSLRMRLANGKTVDQQLVAEVSRMGYRLDRVGPRHPKNRGGGVAAAQMFRAREGHLDVPTDHVEDGFALGHYLCRARVKRASGSLAQGTVTALTDLGFDWESKPTVEYRRRMLAAVAAHHRRVGSINPPISTKTSDGGQSVRKFLEGARRRGRDAAPPEVRDTLDRLGFDWDYRAADRSMPVSVFEDWHREHGHLDITHETSFNGWHIGYSLTALRKRYWAGTLDGETIELLDRLGVEWKKRESKPHRFGHGVGIDYARDYYAENGTLSGVGSRAIYDGFPLGKFLANNKARPGSKMNDRLHEIDPEWSPSRDPQEGSPEVRLERGLVA